MMALSDIEQFQKLGELSDKRRVDCLLKNISLSRYKMYFIDEMSLLVVEI